VFMYVYGCMCVYSRPHRTVYIFYTWMDTPGYTYDEIPQYAD
jgi:hypothetical protein